MNTIRHLLACAAFLVLSAVCSAKEYDSVLTKDGSVQFIEQMSM